MRSRFLLLLAFLMATECAYIEYTGQWPPADSDSPNTYYTNPDDELIYLVPYKEFYNAGEDIKGVFKNNTSDTLYIFFPHGGGDSPLQKWNGENWEIVNTHREGMYYTQAVRYVPLERGETRTLTFPEKRLKEKEMEVAGVYRFLFTITYNDRYGSKSKQVTSRPFVVE